MPDDPLVAGEAVGRYRIVGRLGAGGMGVVYRAHDPVLKRDVAIKRLTPGMGDEPDARARLVREAQSMAALNHPNICTVFEVGMHAGRDFIAMELVEGRTLQELVPPDGFPLPEVLRLGTAIADALGQAHEQGLVHRDLKTANVMMRTTGEVKVMDFGLARREARAEDDTTGPTLQGLTRTGTVLGTTHSMPPEALRGSTADARADVWALGVVLYELATGRLPFTGGTHYEVAAQILSAEPAPLSDRAPAALRAVIAHCLEKEPARRYRQGGEVRAALEAVALSGTPVASEAVPAARPAEVPQPVRLARDRRESHPHSGRPLPWRAVLGGAVAIAVVVAGLRLGPALWRAMLPRAAENALAVLPLENLSRDTSQDYFADGMTEEISTRLAQISALRVIAHGSVAGLVEKGTSLSEIGHRLGVAVLLRGTVFNAGGSVAITVQLIEAATGHVRWANSYQKPFVDVLTLQNDVALAIAHEIQVEITPQEASRLGHAARVDTAAYVACLKGRRAWQAYTLAGFQEAERQFRAALEVSPDYAPAWAGLADAAYGMSSLFLAPNEAMPRARAAAERALALDSTLADAQISTGIAKMVYDWDWREGERRFRRALALRPGDANAHYWLGHLLVLQGRSDEGIEHCRKALEIDPLSSFYSANLGWKLYFAHRFPEALAHLKSAVITYPDDYSTHVFLGLALEQTGDHAGAVAAMERGVGLSANSDNRAQLAHGYSSAGRRTDALRIIHELEQERRQRFVPAADIAYAYSGLGDSEPVFRWLELALDDHSEMLTALKVDPVWEPYRHDPRFQRALKRMNLER